MLKVTLAALLIAAPVKSIHHSAASLGVSGADLADTPTTNAINMEEGSWMNQLSLEIAVTPGTSLVVDVRCYESYNGTDFGQIAICDTSPTSACIPDVRRFTLADWTADGDGVKHLVSRWPTTKRFIRCSVDDPADGDGTVSIVAVRTFR